MKKYVECRILTIRDLRSLCIENDWYTLGTNEEYENLFSKLYDEDGVNVEMTTEKIAEIAEDIMEHSEIKDYTITTVMFAIARKCTCFFSVEIA